MYLPLMYGGRGETRHGAGEGTRHHHDHQAYRVGRPRPGQTPDTRAGVPAEQGWRVGSGCWARWGLPVRNADGRGRRISSFLSCLKMRGRGKDGKLAAEVRGRKDGTWQDVTREMYKRYGKTLQVEMKKKKPGASSPPLF